MNNLSDFAKGLIAGAVGSAVVFGVITVIWFAHNRERTKVREELLKYVEKQNEIEALREDYINRDPYDFLDDVPGARRAADDASADFRRKRDEAVQRFRNRLAD